MIDAKVILDSVNEYGDRLTTVEATFHRFILCEINTHRSHSRNSASSRAIPVSKQLKKVLETPAFPLVWASEQKGMQGGPPLEGDDFRDARDLFERVWANTYREVKAYVDSHPIDEEGQTRLHKSLLNRLLEPFMWHTAILSATDAGWENFFKLRSGYFTKLAQPEFMAVADLIYDAMQASTPQLLQHGQWHTPYIRPDDYPAMYGIDDPFAPQKVSTARCGRVSYLTHDGIRDLNEDIAMFGRLDGAEPPHDSPFEHVATPAYRAEETKGNFTGWHQFRHYRGEA